MVMSCFPVSLPVNDQDANWAAAIFGGVLLIALVSYVLQGRTEFEGPVVFVEGRRREGVGLQKA